MKKKAKATFNVLIWDFNHDNLEHYDVLPYFRRTYAEREKKSKSKRIQKVLEKYPEMKKYHGVPASFEEMKEFVQNESMYMYWARCEWEMICHGWPVQKRDYKIDVHEQIMMNLDIITGILWKEVEEKDGKKQEKVG